MTTSFCYSCKSDLPLLDFHRSNTRKAGVQGLCKLCKRAEYEKNKSAVLARSKKWKENNPLKADAIHRNSHYKSTYGITLAEYERRSAEQNGKCAICTGQDEKKNLAVDHDHETGEIRGLLCSNCNRAIGLLQENPLLLAAALKYLSNPKNRRRAA